MCYFKIMWKQLGTIIHQVCNQSYHTCGGDYSPYIQSIVFPDIFYMSTLFTTTCESLWLHTSVFFIRLLVIVTWLLLFLSLLMWLLSQELSCIVVLPLQHTSRHVEFILDIWCSTKLWLCSCWLLQMHICTLRNIIINNGWTSSLLIKLLV